MPRQWEYLSAVKVYILSPGYVSAVEVYISSVRVCLANGGLRLVSGSTSYEWSLLLEYTRYRVYILLLFGKGLGLATSPQGDHLDHVSSIVYGLIVCGR